MCKKYLLGGLAQIDANDWKQHTELAGYSINDAVIIWFWKVRLILYQSLDYVC